MKKFAMSPLVCGSVINTSEPGRTTLPHRLGAPVHIRSIVRHTFHKIKRKRGRGQINAHQTYAYFCQGPINMLSKNCILQVRPALYLQYTTLAGSARAGAPAAACARPDAGACRDARLTGAPQGASFTLSCLVWARNPAKPSAS